MHIMKSESRRCRAQEADQLSLTLERECALKGRYRLAFGGHCHPSKMTPCMSLCHQAVKRNNADITNYDYKLRNL